MALTQSKPRRSLWDTKLGAAIAELYSSLDVVETNEPINRSSGNIPQAKLEHRNAESFRRAIEILEARATQ